MINENDTTKPEVSPKQEAGEGCSGASCSALDFLSQELDMPAEHIREAAMAIREEKLAKKTDELHSAIFTMLHDWWGGDFKLPSLAKIHMEVIEGKAVELGKVLFRMQNVKEHAPSLAGASVETGVKP